MGGAVPEPGGMTSAQLMRAVRRVAHEVGMVGMDVVEVSPPYDHVEITAMLANRVVLEALSTIARRRADADGGTTWERRTPLLADRPSPEPP